MVDVVNPAIAQKEGEDKGFEAIPFNAFNTSWAHVGTYSEAGYQVYQMISKNCNYPDRAMDFLNYIHSYEGSRLINSGIKGTHWDVINGKPQWNDETFKAYRNEKDFMIKTGIMLYTELSGIDGQAIDPSDDGYINLTKAPEALERNCTTAVDKDFSQHYGATFPGGVWDKLLQEGKVKTAKSTYSNYVYSSFGQKETEDIQKKQSNVEEYLKKNYAKCILAESDDEFKKAVEKQKGDLKALGIDELRQWYINQIDQANKVYAGILSGK